MFSKRLTRWPVSHYSLMIPLLIVFGKQEVEDQSMWKKHPTEWMGIPNLKVFYFLGPEINRKKAS